MSLGVEKVYPHSSCSVLASEGIIVFLYHYLMFGLAYDCISSSTTAHIFSYVLFHCI